MKKNIKESRLLLLILHQAFTIAMAISIYAYDYIILHNQNRNEIGYLIVFLVSMLGAVISLIMFCRMENIIVKKKKEKRIIDRIYLEVLILGCAFLLILLADQMKSIDIGKYSLAGLSIIVGTIVYLMDIIVVGTLSSIYYRIVKKHIAADSLIYMGWRILSNYEKGKGFQEISKKAQEQAKIKEALMAAAINRIKEGLKDAVEARTRDERMKADLITNVSHDIKTPLTSIVNYVDLLKREELDNVNAKNYIRIIDEKAQRLKHLTEDLVEISKISSGNIKLEKQTIDFLELLYQTGGEFNERFEQRNLTIVTKLPSACVMIEADGRQLYRAIENLYTNAAKYALENTKVYVELAVEKKNAIFSIKNISKNHIDVSRTAYQDLTERFVRGEASRTTEGSGLGLSIAKSLTLLMGGRFSIRLEGELFIAEIIFPLANSR